MWNKTGLHSPISSGSQISELFIESERVIDTWRRVRPVVLLTLCHSWGAWGEALPIKSHLKSLVYNMPQRIFEIVVLQTIITSHNLRTCFLPCSPSKGLPRFPVHVCARGKILAPIPKTFVNCETIVFDNISNMGDILFEHFWTLHHLPANQGTACLQVGFAAHNHYLDEE